MQNKPMSHVNSIHNRMVHAQPAHHLLAVHYIQQMLETDKCGMHLAMDM
jgi:hypothetical protein